MMRELSSHYRGRPMDFFRSWKSLKVALMMGISWGVREVSAGPLATLGCAACIQGAGVTCVCACVGALVGCLGSGPAYFGCVVKLGGTACGAIATMCGALCIASVNPFV